MTENPESRTDDVKICADHVRNNDPDRYLCAMFTPVIARPALMSLYAFNIELALVRERVNEQLLGEMRFQWWREQIDHSYEGTARPEGIAGALYDFIRDYNPPRHCFHDLINSRTRDLSDGPFKDLIAFEDYCSGTTAPLIQLSLVPLAPKGSHDLIPEPLARNMGVAWAIIGLIRAIPTNAAHGRCMIPLSLMEHYGVTREAVFSNQTRSILKHIARDMAASAQIHLESARVQIYSANDALFPGFLPLVMADYYLRSLQKSEYDPFHARVQHPNSAVRALRLMFAAWRKRC